MIGCDSSDSLNRQAISGTVTLDGQPISTGAILFEPATQESGTAVGATIRQGTFAVSRRDGAVPGPYLVRVYSSSKFQAPPTKGQTDRTPRPMVESLPPRYNTQTELRVRVRDRSANRYNFDLKSDGLTDLR
jgi:2-polyprenyl-6-methoxyphenol hydroxylase-like FAD-dependent oxidoreductase